MSVVARVDGWEVLDSRGRPTVAARVELADGSAGIARVPAGASAGAHEAQELRDGGARYAGRGATRAVRHVMQLLATSVRGTEPDQVDAALAAADPSPGFRELGANAVLAISLATVIAAASSSGTSLARYLACGDPRPLLLPVPMVNVLSGGAHAGEMINMQDFLAVPVGATSFSEALEWSVRVRDRAEHLALERGHRQAILAADEGGLGLALDSNRAALEILADSIEATGLTLGAEMAIAIDVAASQFYKDGAYRLARRNQALSSDEMIATVADWCSQFPIVSVEDLLAEDDWQGWTRATAELGDKVELVGDDLFATNLDRLDRGVREHVANSVLIKVNQNGLVSGAQAVMVAARSAGYGTVVSARSGETEDTWLADLAVGWRASQIKVGSTRRSERTAKWNRLLELESLENTTYAGPWPNGRPRRDICL